jgi:hypothetical protein
MHDGAGLHRGYIVRDILREMQIRVMSWPSYSPDSNPIIREPMGFNEG